MNCLSVAVFHTLVQIRINIHLRNNKKKQYKEYKTQQIQVHILPKHPHITKQIKTNTVHSTQMKQSQYNQIPSV